jgi:hypothetical protein
MGDEPIGQDNQDNTNVSTSSGFRVCSPCAERDKTLDGSDGAATGWASLTSLLL